MTNAAVTRVAVVGAVFASHGFDMRLADRRQGRSAHRIFTWDW